MLGFTGQGQHRSTRRGREKTYAAVAEECLPPRVLDSKGNCVSDPRGDPVPVYCQRRPSSSRCRAWKTKEKRKYRRYSKRLRKSYNYRYRRSQRNQGHMSRWTRNQVRILNRLLSHCKLACKFVAMLTERLCRSCRSATRTGT